MPEFITKVAFAGKVKSIKASTGKLRDDVQAALIAATYLCIKDSGNTTPFQQILDAVGSAVHRKGISAWIEYNAPVRFVKDKPLLNKAAWQELDRDGILADFAAHVAESGMDEMKWHMVAATENKTESVWDYTTAFDNLFKKLEKNNQSELAKAMREAYDAYLTNALKATLQPSQEA